MKKMRSLFLCFFFMGLVAIIVLSVDAAPVQSSSDDVRWIQNSTNGHYYILIKHMDWPHAEGYAVKLGGHLVTINDREEELWLKDQFGRDDFFWIGFNDINDEGNWKWVSGEPIKYTNWWPGGPNNRGGDGRSQNAAIMNSGGNCKQINNKWNCDRGDGWDDQEETNFYRAIIETTEIPNNTQLSAVSGNPASFYRPVENKETNWMIIGGGIILILIGITTVGKVYRNKRFKNPEHEAKQSLQEKDRANLLKEFVEIKRGYEVLIDNNVKFGIKVINNGNSTISDVEVILDYPETLFELQGHKTRKLGTIPSTVMRTAEFIMKPRGCIHKENVSATIVFKDYRWKKQIIEMRPKEMHCIIPFLREKPLTEAEYIHLAAGSNFVQEGISFKGISVEDFTKFMEEKRRHMQYKVKEYNLGGKKVIYLSGESVGENAYYLLTVVLQNYNGLTQVVLRAYSDKKYGLNGFINEIADSIKNFVTSIQNAKEIGIIENTQVINIMDSVVMRTSFDIGEGGNTQVNIRNSVVQRTNIR